MSWVIGFLNFYRCYFFKRLCGNWELCEGARQSTRKRPETCNFIFPEVGVAHRKWPIFLEMAAIKNSCCRPSKARFFWLVTICSEVAIVIFALTVVLKCSGNEDRALFAVVSRQSPPLQLL